MDIRKELVGRSDSQFCPKGETGFSSRRIVAVDNPTLTQFIDHGYGREDQIFDLGILGNNGGIGGVNHLPHLSNRFGIANRVPERCLYPLSSCI